MTSRAEKRRKKSRAKAVKDAQARAPADNGLAPVLTQHSGSQGHPTAERRARGVWADPKGGQKDGQASVDLASDMVGRLHCDGLISDNQKQAARAFQNLRAAYITELPGIEGYRSCLSDATPGFDDGDGNPRIIAAYRAVERLLGQAGLREVLWVCDRDLRPTKLPLLRVMLSRLHDGR